jgi:hypothetical protein
VPRPTKRKPPTGRAMQWGDIPREGQQDLNAQMRERGMAASGIGEQRTRLEEARDRPGNLPRTARKAEQRLTSLSALSEHLEDKPITHQGAAGARVGLVTQGAKRTLAEGTDPGHDWYFQHHRKLENVAAATGHDKYKVIAASAVMSPQNNPEQELTAVHALAHAHANPTSSVLVTPKAAKGNPQLADYVGREVHPSDMHPTALAAISQPGVREHVQTRGVDLESIAKGGVKGNVVKAIDVLRGNVHHEDAINPKTSPKVWSYHENIAKAEYGSAEHEEFGHRMRTATGLTHVGETPGQQSFDLGGGQGRMFPELATATHGPLDPRGHTAEDTWQQAISTRQRLPVVDVPGRSGRAAKQSPAKFSVGEGGQANQKLLSTPAGMTGTNPSATMHAWQNEATVRAGRILSGRSGEVVPSMGVQAGGWTEARRHAGKAIEEQVAQPKSGGPRQLSFLTGAGKISPSAMAPKNRRRG